MYHGLRAVRVRQLLPRMGPCLMTEDQKEFTTHAIFGATFIIRMSVGRLGKTVGMCSKLGWRLFVSVGLLVSGSHDSGEIAGNLMMLFINMLFVVCNICYL